MEIKGNINAGYGNSITGGTKSSIVGGEGNSNSASQSFIGGGYNNTVSGAYGSSVVGGRDNTLNGSYYASVVGGRGNQISGGINTYSTIGGGDYNLITNTSRRSFIGNGTSNEISGATKSSIVGGDDNYVSEGFTNFGHLFIGGGQNNTIFKTNWSTIGGGYGNTINKLNVIEINSANNFIGGGFGNQIYNGAYTTIGGGYQNYINAGSYNYSTIGGGRQNQIIGYSKASFIGGGVGNLITNFNTHYSQYASIVGGLDNGLTGSSYSTISGGRNNRIVNTIQYYGHNFIGNGLNNTINGPYGGYSTIIGGYNNSMISNYGGSILGGNSNTIFGSPLQFPANSSIVGGFNNTIQLSDTAFIGAGNNNYIRGQASIILGGTNNTIGSVSFQRNNCSILGGINNTIQHNSSHIIGSNITSVAANTTHVEGLNIGTIGGGTPVGNLGFDSSGNVVTGTTGGGGGESNTASNVGVGQGVFKQKSGVDLQFYSLSGGTNTTLTLNGDTVVVDSTGGSSTTGSYTPNKYINTGGVTVPAIVGNHHIIDNGHPSNPTTYELPDTGTTIGDMIKFTVLDGVCRVKPINSQFLTYGNTATAVGAPVDITTASWFTLFEGESLEVVYVGSKNVGSSQKWIISNFSSFEVNDSVGTSRVGI